ncbi:hypothetical protein TTHERM_00316540 (macronuclear) [Tetrahymena thermophila SB210]|uniref:Uncharacterized protein n=1 Tax=Tetrahymena thermophila (strain SB210) TaxID=312017 RepID=I7ML36_TETTS|nr:hypothetical protein TTHERM_00316540 [Tetrahymena thermophila SB210]EAS01101.1 hypothetical protein TTHERM_00316540 [Tetrahymena thermophila SB210]|eukprot:XP_001021346.1 hypothetical protein TTHERM_00316540 [Tetrahymena thermophila SB210]
MYQQQPPYQKPSKQGGLYSLNLGQNNGPYLTKDIMITNHKSLQLLNGKDEVAKSAASILSGVGTSILNAPTVIYEPPDIYDERTQQFTNYDERYQSKLSASDSMNSVTQLIMERVSRAKESSKEYEELANEYKRDLENIQHTIHNNNINNIKEIQPMLREFHQRLKERLQEEKNENYKLQRELEQLNRDKLQLQQQLLFCSKRVQDLQKYTGILNVEPQYNEGSDDEDQESDND